MAKSAFTSDFNKAFHAEPAPPTGGTQKPVHNIAGQPNLNGLKCAFWEAAGYKGTFNEMQRQWEEAEKPYAASGTHNEALIKFYKGKGATGDTLNSLELSYFSGSGGGGGGTNPGQPGKPATPTNGAVADGSAIPATGLNGRVEVSFSLGGGAPSTDGDDLTNGTRDDALDAIASSLATNPMFKVVRDGAYLVFTPNASMPPITSATLTYTPAAQTQTKPANP